jgi:23S rRNA (cytidine2498-2'-O)-methyltransferase
VSNHVFLWAEDSEADLRAELASAFPGIPLKVGASLVEVDVELLPARRLPHLAFARQWLPHARPLRAESIRAWAAAVADAVAGVLPDDQPWSLLVEPHYGVAAAHRIGARAWHSATRQKTSDRPRPLTPRERFPDSEAGRHRCRLIREATVEILAKRRRHLLRRLRPEPMPFTSADSLVQLLLTAPDAGFLSVCGAPLPFEQRHLLSPFPKGEVEVAPDQAAPSRAFAKLVEAELRLGRSIRSGETCVDLGASPGSWTHVAANRGARVTAIDRSPLRNDLMRHRQVEFQAGDAFRFKPDAPVDWLLCDVIAAPERTAELLADWLQRRWCRRFIVTLKLKDASTAAVLEIVKHNLPPLCQDMFLTRLCANKKEVCAFGTAGIHD